MNGTGDMSESRWEHRRSRPRWKPTADVPRTAHGAFVFLGVLIADLIIVAIALMAAIAIGFQSWGGPEQVGQSLAGKQEGQVLTAAAIACLLLALVALLAWKQRAVVTVLFQGVVILVVIGIAGSMAADYHHEDQKSGSTRQRQLPSNTGNGSYCSGGQCPIQGG